MQLNRRTIAGVLIAASATLAIGAPIAAGATPSKKQPPVIVPGTPHAVPEMNVKARNQSAKVQWIAPIGGATVHCYKARLLQMDGTLIAETVATEKLKPNMSAKLVLPREAASLGDWYVVQVVSVGYTSVPAVGETPPCDGPESGPGFQYTNLRYKK